MFSSTLTLMDRSAAGLLPLAGGSGIDASSACGCCDASTSAVAALDVQLVSPVAALDCCEPGCCEPGCCDCGCCTTSLQ